MLDDVIGLQSASSLPERRFGLPEEAFFVGLGAQKAGTSWLWDYLTDHPETAPAPIKELHYFDSRYTAVHAGEKSSKDRMRKHAKALGRFARTHPGEGARKVAAWAGLLRGDDRAYRRFLRYRPDPTRIAGEITPDYMMMEADGFRAIEAALPAPRYLVLLRNPVDRFWSQVRYRSRWAGDLTQAEDLGALLEKDVFRLKSDYARFLRTLETVVPPERVHVTFYEHLFDFARAQCECDRICAFLSIAPRAARVGTASNVGDRVSDARLDRRDCVRRLSESYRLLAERAGDDLPQSWREDVRLLDGVGETAPARPVAPVAPVEQV